MRTAITRQVSDSIARCELEFASRKPIDQTKATLQHLEYEEHLKRSGAAVLSLSSDSGFPDGVFVEDPAIVLEDIAVLCRMGAVSRRGEAESLARVLRNFRPLQWIQEPATLEGGDVMVLGKNLFCGISRRTNLEGARQLAQIIERFGYSVVPVPVSGCLHLKSAVCPLPGDALIANRRWIDMRPFDGFRIIEVAEDEPAAANVLALGDQVLMPASFPKTRERLERSGFSVSSIDISELQKAEAGVTCSSLIFDAAGPR